MRRISCIVGMLYCLSPITQTFASENVDMSTDTADTQDNNSGAESQKKLVKYLLNLGLYLGYNLKQNPEEQRKEPVRDKLLQATEQSVNERDKVLITAMNSYLGASLVNTTGTALFVPDSTTYNIINNLSNNTFRAPPYQSTSQGAASINPLIDQQTYQADPVSQAVWNTLGTPNYSYCLDNEEDNLAKCTYDSKIINANEVMLNVIGGEPPTMNEFFTYSKNQPYLSELNGNGLITPLLYSSSSNQSQSTSSGNTQNTQKGLTSSNQIEEAANFVRYASAAVVPLNLARRKEYQSLYSKFKDKDRAEIDRYEAKSLLARYLNSIRVYAAQRSVAVSNLYSIMSRRLPQKANPASDATPTSQALSDFKMATWRIFKPEEGQQSTNKSWVEELNTASPASVQKEIAVLLAEINYQMYLSRQEQERLLLTQSIQLIRQLSDKEPNLALMINEYSR